MSMVYVKKFICALRDIDKFTCNTLISSCCTIVEPHERTETCYIHVGVRVDYDFEHHGLPCLEYQRGPKYKSAETRDEEKCFKNGVVHRLKEYSRSRPSIFA
ncbi:hypothetical protein RF11_06959 [Thelohanellus kitauei]|uniref:Uncharacterized protein n=1 Tax=Thelohanellus kitauei TaxID=669202 RepID=A0A0C2M4H6_THEKT|nr:hypothetical protein RF11_06959 [Thelohanellus kitauei]